MYGEGPSFTLVQHIILWLSTSMSFFFLLEISLPYPLLVGISLFQKHVFVCVCVCFIWEAEKQRQTDTQIPHLLHPHIPRMVRTEPTWSQEVDLNSELTCGCQRPKYLTLFPPRVWLLASWCTANRKKWKQNVAWKDEWKRGVYNVLFQGERPRASCSVPLAKVNYCTLLSYKWAYYMN